MACRPFVHQKQAGWACATPTSMILRPTVRSRTLKWESLACYPLVQMLAKGMTGTTTMDLADAQPTFGFATGASMGRPFTSRSHLGCCGRFSCMVSCLAATPLSHTRRKQHHQDTQTQCFSQGLLVIAGCTSVRRMGTLLLHLHQLPSLSFAPALTVAARALSLFWLSRHFSTMARSAKG